MEEYFQKALSHCIDIGMKQPYSFVPSAQMAAC